MERFANALLSAKRDIHYCPCCQNLTEMELCSVCADEERDHSLICVVESPKDVTALERTGEYTGVYHVLHGLISPIDGITPDKLRIGNCWHACRTARCGKSSWRPIPL